MLQLFFVSGSMGQSDSLMSALNNKIDSLITLIYPMSQQINIKVKDQKIDSLATQISLLQSSNSRLEQNIKSLNENTNSLKRNNLERSKENLKMTLDLIMQMGSGLSNEKLDYYLIQAKENEILNLNQFMEYTKYYKQLEDLKEEFTKMDSFEDITIQSSILSYTFQDFAGLEKEVNLIVFLMTNYCEIEKKLIETVKRFNSLPDDEIRTKNFSRNEKYFTEYPNLIRAFQKCKADRGFVFIPKCN